MITITLDPALRPSGAAPTQVFEDVVTRITFGRNPDSMVPLNRDQTKLGRTHFELRRAGAGVELVADREHPVYVDGQRVVERLMLPMRQDVRLIDPMSGPVITIVCTKTGDVAATEQDALSDSGTQQGQLQGVKTQVLRLAMVAGVAALVFGGYSFWTAQQRAAREQALLTDMQALTERMAAAEAKTAQWPSVQQKVKPSVYQVTFADASGATPLHQGTAFVYGPDRLATNAHVASLFNNPMLQGRILLIPADPAMPSVPVIGVELHPAYLAYRTSLADAQQPGKLPPLANLGSYDVAFLEVPKGASLGPPLPLATGDDALSPGSPVAYLGYPERCARHANQLHIKSGIISGVSDFLGRDAGQDLIYHTAPGAGGASGSPLLNAEGEVVGVFSGGEPAKPVEAVADAAASDAATPPAAEPKGCGISGASTLYAQNALLLRELETGAAQEKQAAREADWRNSALYKLNQDQIWVTVSSLAEEPQSSDTVHVRTTALSRSVHAKTERGASVETFAGLGPGTYVAFANVAPDADVTLMVRAGAVDIQTPVKVDNRPTAIFSLANTEDVIVSLAGQDALKVDVVVARVDTSSD